MRLARPSIGTFTAAFASSAMFAGSTDDGSKHSNNQAMKAQLVSLSDVIVRNFPYDTPFVVNQAHVNN
jgi:hypothetical protein